MKNSSGFNFFILTKGSAPEPPLAAQFQTPVIDSRTRSPWRRF